jgi:ABC-type amino acid transport substrate-binding protein
MHANCHFVVAPFAEMLPGLEGGKFDVAAVSMLNTPERRARVLLSKPYYRSRTMWFGRPGINPGDEKVRVAVMSGSAQERYAQAQHWQTRSVPGHADLAEQIAQGYAQAMLTPQSNAIYLMQQASFRKLGLVSQVMDGEGLGGDVSFGIAPGKVELKKNIDMALERINRDGRYDRINSEFLPFRID